MRFIKIFGIGIVLSIAVIYFASRSIESGDINAMSMYFVVFLIPAIVLAMLNAAYLVRVDRSKSIQRKIVFSLLPILFLVLLAFTKKITVPFFDGSLAFLGLFGAIGLGLTNLFWCTQLKRSVEQGQSNG